MTALWPGFAPRKLAGAAAVFILHLLVALALLSATQWHGQKAEQSREIVLHLVALPRPLPVTQPNARPKKKIVVPSVEHPATPPALVVPPYLQTPAPTAPPLQGVGKLLFGCSPDQLANATPEQRAACANASLTPRIDPNAVDYRDHTDRSKSAAQWARDRARKNAPILLPCMSPGGFNPIYTAACIAKSVVTGKIDKDDPGYQDMPQSAPNEGDTRMAPVPH